MQMDDRSNEETRLRPELSPARSSAEVRMPVIPQAEMEVPVAGQQAIRRRDELTPERIARIRQRIVDGAYASDAVLDTVARRLLRSGDL
ncbi:MAG TPA: hypothetical protein VF761_03025 [Gemmatimonadaceae bacterium]